MPDGCLSFGRERALGRGGFGGGAELADRAWWRGLAAGAGIGALTAGLWAGVGVRAAGTAAIHVEVNGQAVSLGAAPVMISDHVYLPIRYIAQALGLPVHWDAGTRTVLVGSVPTGGQATAGSFTYQGLEYAATALSVRTYPGAQASAGPYWILSYSITNTSKQPVNVPQQQPALGLFGPGGAQLAPTASLGGPAPGVINPGTTFSSYLVFAVPVGALPSAYSFGFDTYQVVGGQFTTTPVSAPLGTPSSTQVQTPISATYSLNGVWNSGLQQVTIGKLIQTSAIVPDLSPASFDPSTSFWVLDFSVTNPGPGNVTLAAGNFALNFNDALSISADAVGALPGYVAPSSLDSGGSVTLPAGQTFSGSLLFVIPAGTPTTNPGLQLTVGQQTRIISLSPCTAGNCPPVLQ